MNTSHSNTHYKVGYLFPKVINLDIDHQYVNLMLDHRQTTRVVEAGQGEIPFKKYYFSESNFPSLTYLCFRKLFHIDDSSIKFLYKNYSENKEIIHWQIKQFLSFLKNEISIIDYENNNDWFAQEIIKQHANLIKVCEVLNFSNLVLVFYQICDGLLKNNNGFNIQSCCYFVFYILDELKDIDFEKSVSDKNVNILKVVLDNNF